MSTAEKAAMFNAVLPSARLFQQGILLCLGMQQGLASLPGQDDEFMGVLTLKTESIGNGERREPRRNDDHHVAFAAFP